MEDKPNKLVFKKEDIWLIPNVITYFRMLCIPVFVALCLVGGLKGKTDLIYWALGVFSLRRAPTLSMAKSQENTIWCRTSAKCLTPLRTN